MPTLSRKPNIGTVLKAFESHEAKDIAWFKDTGVKIDKQNERMECLFNEIKTDLSTLTTNQKQHAHESMLFRETAINSLEEIKKHTAPIIKDYEDSQTTKRVIQDKGTTLIKVSSVLVGLGVIVAFLKKIFSL